MSIVYLAHSSYRPWLPKQPPARDWIALEYDVNYHNAGSTANTKLYEIASLDDKAITEGWNECFGIQSIAKFVLASGLSIKKHLETFVEPASWLFGKNNAIYPRQTPNAKPINWFNKKLSRHRGTLTGEEVVV
ncbi:hypothetical protein QTP88_006966 [Uroleucon formosanum]